VSTAGRARRVIASCLVLAAAAAFVNAVGPVPRVVQADVFGPLVRAAFLEAPGRSSSSRRTGTILVNGQAFFYAIGHSPRPVREVLAGFEQQFDVQIPGWREDVRSAASILGKQVGIVAGFRVGPLSAPGALGDRLRFTDSPGRIHELGRFHVAMALEQDGTVFVNLMTGDDVRPATLLPGGTEDAPGTDPAGVIRPPGLQRVLTIEHGDGPTYSRTTFYRGLTQHVPARAFRRSFEDAGWTALMLEAAGATEPLAHFTDGRREAFVGGDGGGVPVAIVVTRLLRR